MYACEKYFNDLLLFSFHSYKKIIVTGISIAACNVIEFLKSKGLQNIYIYDELFSFNDHIKKFKGINVIHEELTAGIDCFFIFTEFNSNKQNEWIIKLKPRNYLVIRSCDEVRIEASGLCNLRCMSCQCGNYDPSVFDFKGRGFMSPELCEQIIDKLCREYSTNMGVFYYIFGEPFLNQELHKLIRIAKNRGLSVILSSNFSFDMPIDNVVDATPDIIKISVSGYSDDIYKKHHNGGSIEKVHRNMEYLCNYLNKTTPDTAVVVGYHIYSDNDGDEIEKTKQLCKKYGFIFAPVKAIYNNPLKRMGLSAFTDKDMEFLKSRYHNYESYLAFDTSKYYINSRCRNIDNKLFIDYNGDIMLCELLYKDGIFRNYLECSMEEIYDWRNRHYICQQCKSHGLMLL